MIWAGDKKKRPEGLFFRPVPYASPPPIGVEVETLRPRIADGRLTRRAAVRRAATVTPRDAAVRRLAGRLTVVRGLAAAATVLRAGRLAVAFRVVVFLAAGLRTVERELVEAAGRAVLLLLRVVVERAALVTRSNILRTSPSSLLTVFSRSFSLLSISLIGSALAKPCTAFIRSPLAKLLLARVDVVAFLAVRRTGVRLVVAFLGFGICLFLLLRDCW